MVHIVISIKEVDHQDESYDKNVGTHLHILNIKFNFYFKIQLYNTFQNRMKIIYYYQTLIGLKSLLEEDKPCTHIILSSIHFENYDGSVYIHLNDHDPNDSIFDDWKELKILSDRGVVIMIMMGGAGGVYRFIFKL